MNELDFLLEDENILDAEISDVVDKDGKETIGISITVGMNEKQVENLLELVGPELTKKIPSGFEIILTKGDLRKINKLLKEYE